MIMAEFSEQQQGTMEEPVPKTKPDSDAAPVDVPDNDSGVGKDDNEPSGGDEGEGSPDDYERAGGEEGGRPKSRNKKNKSAARQAKKMHQRQMQAAMAGYMNMGYPAFHQGMIYNAMFAPPAFMPNMVFPPTHMNQAKFPVHAPMVSGQVDEQNRTNVYVPGLPHTSTDQTLYDMCIGFGGIVSAKVIANRETNQCKGFGFVQFVKPKSANAAIQELRARGIQASFAKTNTSGIVSPPMQPATPAMPPQPMPVAVGRAPMTVPGDLDATNLYFANLPKEWAEQELEEYLSKYGNVVSSRVLRDQVTQISRGVGFARMEAQQICEVIINDLNGKEILPGCMQVLQVRFADSPEKKQRGPKREDRRPRGAPWREQYEQGPVHGAAMRGGSNLLLAGNYMIPAMPGQAQQTYMPPHMPVMSPPPSNVPWYGQQVYAVTPGPGGAPMPGQQPMQFQNMPPPMNGAPDMDHQGPPSMQQLTGQMHAMSLGQPVTMMYQQGYGQAMAMHGGPADQHGGAMMSPSM